MESRSTNAATTLLRGLDWPTLAIYTALVLFGVVSIYAASYDFDNASIFSFDEFSGKQLRWVGLAFVAGAMILLIDIRAYEAYAYPIYAVVVLLLVVTIFVAPDIKGSHSWLVLGPMSLQPAEFGKFATALALAKLFSSYNFSLNASAGNYVKALTIILLPVAVILQQNETGSALAYMALFFVLYREGMSGLILAGAGAAVVIFVTTVKYTEDTILGIPSGEAAVFIMVEAVVVGMLAGYCRLRRQARNAFFWFAATGAAAWALGLCGVEVPGRPFFMAAVGVAVGYVLLQALKAPPRKVLVIAGAALLAVGFLFSVNKVYNDLLQPHQQQRIKVALAIVEDPRGAGYNVNQSKIAIGSGGFGGKGFLNGTQTKLKYVPEQHTDFIFCTIGEEEGFVGAASVLALFLALILRVIALAERQPTTFGRVYGYCVASYLIFHVAVNIGMVIGLCPVIGIPLPFFSYGGSSLWGFTFLLFILLRIDASRRDHHSY